MPLVAPVLIGLALECRGESSWTALGMVATAGAFATGAVILAALA